MTDYRRLGPDERLQWGDECWVDLSDTPETRYGWQPVDTKARALACIGKLAGGCIVRRAVELFNREPTADEMSSSHYPYRNLRALT